MARDVDYERAARLWSQYVGSQGTDEFMRWSRTDDIYEAVEDHQTCQRTAGCRAGGPGLCCRLHRARCSHGAPGMDMAEEMTRRNNDRQ